MSPTNKKKLDLLRIKLDKLDTELLKLIKKRSNLVNNVLKVKIHKKEIIDQKRISFILKKIKKKSIQLKIDPKISNRIWKNMIWSFIDYEKRNFKKNNNYLLCGGNFFSTNISCFLVAGLYFFADNFTLAFSPPAGFLT
jgi:chorismate mutase